MNVIDFDIEEQIESILPEPYEAQTVTRSFMKGMKESGKSQAHFDPRLRTVVCHHWMKGLCQKGDRCEFLHRMDKSRMPVCKHGKKCGNRQCFLRHIQLREKQECVLYNQGFCLHGPLCRFKHIKKPPDEIPGEKEEFLGVAGSNPLDQASGFKRMKTPQSATPNAFYKISLCKHWLETGVCSYADSCHFAHGIGELRMFPGANAVDNTDLSNLPEMKMGTIELPIEYDETIVFFFLKAPNLHAIQVSAARKVWAVNSLLTELLQDAYRKYDRVLLLFHVDEDRFCYGVGELKGSPRNINPKGPVDSTLTNPNWRGELGPLSYEFPIKWLRSVNMPYKLLAHIKTPFSGNIPLVRIQQDAELPYDVGRELLTMIYRYEEFVLETSTISQSELLFNVEWTGDQADSGMDALAPALSFFPISEGSAFVFRVDFETYEQFMREGVFKESKEMLRDARNVIREGTTLFLFNSQDFCFYGIYTATGPVQEINQHPFAFQVGFMTARDFPKLYDQDPQVRDLFREKWERIGPVENEKAQHLANALSSQYISYYLIVKSVLGVVGGSLGASRRAEEVGEAEGGEGEVGEEEVWVLIKYSQDETGL